MPLRQCLRDPIPEILQAARDLDLAVSAHHDGRTEDAAALIARTNLPVIREWTESVWGKNSPYVIARVHSAFADTAIDKIRERMPSAAEKKQLHARDGYHCRFCGIPVIPKEVRVRMRKFYPDALPWGRRNPEQHAAFQAMWAQYDHLVPHALGGTNGLENVVVTCAPCNFGRMSYSLEQVGLSDPRLREPVKSGREGLERF